VTPALVLVLLASAHRVDHARTYLASIVELPVGRNEQVRSFSFETWGVVFDAVCHIPPGWRIKAGSSATPNGVLEGDGSQGATWFNRGSPGGLADLILLRLSGPVQRRNRHDGRGGLVPATFNGYVSLSTDGNDDVRKPLTYRNVRLGRARRCLAVRAPRG
jgi:hypothetical protein